MVVPIRRWVIAAGFAILVSGVSSADAPGNTAPPPANAATPTCGEDRAPFRDLDFLVGKWEFFSLDGKKIADQVYSKRERGCLILEDWTTLTGETGTGMNFVDPATNKWRQVWMSPRFHIDYSGGFTASGDFVLEGRIYPNDGRPAAAVRGVYSRQADGSVTKEFLQLDEDTQTWRRFFIGVARRQE